MAAARRHGGGPLTSVDAVRWDAVKALLHAALELPPAQRDAFVAEACGADAALRAEVASLLAAHDDAFLEAPAFADAAAALESVRDTPMGGRVDAFRIVREIGRGGMGTVYLAERADGQYERRVALKVISRGMDTDLVVRRFRRERQILAPLDHPNIARLLSGGTTDDGRPYFVMEHVEGEPIDAYCATRGLGIGARIALFRRVCDAVQYAHQRLVVHRDLKPGNILVTADGTPKLLDFGIAKVLGAEDGRTHATAATLHAMTPDYASPEQMAREPVTTLSDVYSLGVLLHELLTGRHPRTAEPERPSTAVTRPVPRGAASLAPPGDAASLRRALRGDLDTIVLKAMRREPERRYASAEQLGDDLRRHVERLPVLARPDTFGYRSAQFVRRHRTGVAAAALATTALLAAAGATAWQAHVARVAERRAERRFAEVRQLATSFLFEIDQRIAPLAGATAARELLVRRALASLDGLAREARGDASLLRDLAAAYRRVGDVQGRPYSPNLGRSADALASYRKAIAILEPIVGERPRDVAARRELTLAHQAVGSVQGRMGDVAGAVASQRRALALSESLLAESPRDTDAQRLVSDELLHLGRALSPSGASAAMTRGALDAYRRALAIRRALLAATPRAVPAQRAAALAQEGVSYALWRLGDATADTTHYRAALANLAEAHAVRVVVAATAPDDADFARGAVDGLHEMAQLHLLLGEGAPAVRLLLAARPRVAALSAADPHNLEARRDVAVLDAGLAAAYRRTGDGARAAAAGMRARAALRDIVAADPTSSEDVLQLARADTTLGGIARAAGDERTARARYDEAIALARRWATAQPANALPRHLLDALAARSTAPRAAARRLTR